MIKVISYGKYGKTAQIVIIAFGRSVTKHLKLNYGVWMDKDAKQYTLK